MKTWPTVEEFSLYLFVLWQDNKTIRRFGYINFHSAGLVAVSNSCLQPNCPDTTLIWQLNMSFTKLKRPNRSLSANGDLW